METFNRIYHQSSTKARFFGILYKSFRAGDDERHPQEVLDLLYRCLNPDPEGRPSIVEFETCEWIAKAPEEMDVELREEMEYLYSLERHPADQ